MTQRKDLPDEAVIEAAREHRWPIETAFPDFPPKVVQAKVMQLVRKDVLEYGVSPSYPWPRDYE